MIETTKTSRKEHLKWCKDRAIEILEESGNVSNAYASFASDMSKHIETENHPAIGMGVMLLMGGHNEDISEMKRFIEGFN